MALIEAINAGQFKAGHPDSSLSKRLQGLACIAAHVLPPFNTSCNACVSVCSVESYFMLF
eukprot:1156903-Pelagomonas_calceolata.AAC.13